MLGEQQVFLLKKKTTKNSPIPTLLKWPPFASWPEKTQARRLTPPPTPSPAYSKQLAGQNQRKQMSPSWLLSQLHAARWRGGHLLPLRPHPALFQGKEKLEPKLWSSIGVGQIFPSGVSPQRPKASSPVWPWLPVHIPLLGRRRSALSYMEGVTSEPLWRLRLPPTQSRTMSLIKVLKVLKAPDRSKQTDQESNCQHTVLANDSVTTVFIAEIQQSPDEEIPEKRDFSLCDAPGDLYLTFVF